MTNPSTYLITTAQHWHAQRRPAVVVEVANTRGSVPREAGTRMLVAAGEVVGTIGGGHLEWQAIAAARALLSGNLLGVSSVGAPVASASASASADATRRLQHVALGPSLGQCCGGVLDLRYTPLAELATADITAWAVMPPRFHLQLYGAGHVGRAIVRLLEGLTCKVQWIDERENEFPPLAASASESASAAHIERLCVEPVQAEVALAPPGAFYLVLTHSHDLDLALTQAILTRGDFGFFGLIGSKTKYARFEHRLRERGFAPDLIDRITCPIGVPGIEGKEPEVIAVAVVAQLLLVASGGKR